MRSICIFFIISSLFCITAPLAWAKGDPCHSLDKNNQWNEGISEISANYKSKNYDTALKKADELSAICPRSPILNYFRGRIYREKGDDTKALFYIQLATNSTEEFAVKGDLLERMWYERYEIEHSEARPENITAREKTIADLQKRAKTAEDQLTERASESRFSDYDTIQSYATGMWTGVAVSTAGLILTGVGAGLYAGKICKNKKECKAVNFKYEIKETTDDDIGQSNGGHAFVAPEYSFSIGMMCAGVGLTIVGAIFTGIFGYKYTKAKQEVDSIAFSISPDGANLSFTF